MCVCVCLNVSEVLFSVYAACVNVCFQYLLLVFCFFFLHSIFHYFFPSFFFLFLLISSRATIMKSESQTLLCFAGFAKYLEEHALTCCQHSAHR